VRGCLGVMRLLLKVCPNLVRQNEAMMTKGVREDDSLNGILKCSRMKMKGGGRKGLISVSFNPTSSGQVSLIIYEWSDVSYLGVDTPGNEVGGVIRPVRLIS
jgi:hypothetical protein